MIKMEIDKDKLYNILEVIRENNLEIFVANVISDKKTIQKFYKRNSKIISELQQYINWDKWSIDFWKQMNKSL